MESSPRLLSLQVCSLTICSDTCQVSCSGTRQVQYLVGLLQVYSLVPALTWFSIRSDFSRYTRYCADYQALRQVCRSTLDIRFNPFPVGTIRRSRFTHYHCFQKYLLWELEHLFVEDPLVFYTRRIYFCLTVAKKGRLANP